MMKNEEEVKGCRRHTQACKMAQQPKTSEPRHLAEEQGTPEGSREEHIGALAGGPVQGSFKSHRRDCTHTTVQEEILSVQV